MDFIHGTVKAGRGVTTRKRKRKKDVIISLSFVFHVIVLAVKSRCCYRKGTEGYESRPSRTCLILNHPIRDAFVIWICTKKIPIEFGYLLQLKSIFAHLKDAIVWSFFSQWKQRQFWVDIRIHTRWHVLLKSPSLTQDFTECFTQKRIHGCN